jgi:hypothetical protein
MFWGVLAGAVIAAPALWRAHADPGDISYIVCGALAANPTIGNVTRVLETIEAGGVSRMDAARIVVDSVENACPRYLRLLQLYIETYSPDATPASPAPPADQVIA